MATEILRPQDCLRPNHFYDPFSPPKPITNRRRSRPVRATPSPPNSKHGRPNPKSTRKASSSSPSSSPPSTSPLSTSPVHEGFRLLKRGEAFRLAPQSGSEKKSPVVSKPKKHEPSTEVLLTLTGKVPALRRSEPPPPPSRVEKTPPQKKTQSDRAKPDRLTPPPLPPRLFRFGSDKDSCFAGPNFAVQAPEASCLPQPGFLLRSASGGPTSDDEASRALRSLLKLQFL